jgi:magnesium transporter
MIKFYIKTIKQRKLKEIPNFEKGCLIYVKEPSTEEIDQLGKKFFLDKSLLQDALDPNEIPRIETKRNVRYIFLHAPLAERNTISTVPFLFVVAADFTLILLQRGLPFLERFLLNFENFYTTQKLKFFLQILSLISNQYQFFVLQISKKIKSLGLIIKEVEEKDILQLLNFEIIFQDFSISLSNLKSLFSRLLYLERLEFYPEDKELINDILLQIEELQNIVIPNLKNIIHIREIHEIVLSNRVNQAVKLLTALTVILGIPTVIASLYGMNLRLPLAENPFSFWIINFFTLALILLLVFVFKKRKWF